MKALADRLKVTTSDDGRYRAQLFRLAHAPDRERLEALLRSEAAPAVFDSIDRQLAELVKTRHPDRRLTPEQQNTLIARELDGRPAAEYGVWAYYSWSRRLVHILDEREFAQLRTNRNTYKISPAERDVLARKRVGVVGLSVGQSAAVVLALERSFGELRVADFDTLDLSNLNRLRAGVHNVGVPKILVTAREIAEIDPFLNVVCYGEGITSSNVDAFLRNPEPLDLLIEECDSIDLKIEIRHAAKRHRIPVVMDTSDRGLLDIERFDLEPDRPIFHGLIGEMDPATLRGLSTEEKVPYVLKIIGSETISTRLRASLLEVEQTISTWPQLASAVAMGGAVAAETARRILLAQLGTSGRFFIDVEQAVRDVYAGVHEGGVEAEPPAARSCHIGHHCRPSAGGLALSQQQVRQLVYSATLAPSGGNSQPWRWIWSNRQLQLHLDPSHTRARLDFQSLASVAALGAAVENLVLAAHAARLGVHVSHPLPDGEASHVATMTFRAFGASDDEPHDADRLAEWIRRRTTNRRHAPRHALSESFISSLEQSIGGFAGVHLRLLRTDHELDEVGRLLGIGDRLLFLDRELHAEVMSEIVFDRAARRSRGIPVETLQLNPADRAGLELARSWDALALVKEWAGGRNLEKMARKAVAGASAVGMIAVSGTDRVDYFRGGRAFERLWLKATKLGLGLQPMSALSYLFARMNRGGGSDLAADTLAGLRALWPRWAALFGVAAPEAEVLVFRLSHAAPPAARAPRCAVDDVLELRE